MYCNNTTTPHGPGVGLCLYGWRRKEDMTPHGKVSTLYPDHLGADGFGWICIDFI